MYVCVRTTVRPGRDPRDAGVVQHGPRRRSSLTGVACGRATVTHGHGPIEPRCYARSSPHPSALLRPCVRPSERVPASSVPSKPPPVAAGGGLTERAGPGRARTVAKRAGTALTGAVRTGLYQAAGTIDGDGDGGGGGGGSARPIQCSIGKRSEGARTPVRPRLSAATAAGRTEWVMIGYLFEQLRRSAPSVSPAT